jgi:hypothetical protein
MMNPKIKERGSDVVMSCVWQSLFNLSESDSGMATSFLFIPITVKNCVFPLLREAQFLTEGII